MFAYLRIFSILSLVVMVLLAVSSGMFFRSLAADHITSLAESSNSSLAQGYVNAVWKKYRNTIVPLANNPAQLKSNPEVAQFAQETVHYFQGMPLVRVNIYSATGALLMLADISPNHLVNVSVSPDNAFVQGKMKSPAATSELLHEVSLQTNPTATLVQTVVPIHGTEGGEAEGALEVLSDVTGPWHDLVNFQIYGTAGIIVIFIAFLVVLYITSKHTEVIIARQHEANEELSAAAASAQAENQQKSQFLANITHELRTPLNAIIGFSNIIKTEVLPKIEERKYQDYINDIHSSGVHLLSLINDILDYSKAEAGKLELEVSEVNASKMVQNCLRLVAPRAESGEIRLSEFLPPEQLIMRTDSKKFKQILLNLLSNAVKFTQPGGEVIVNGWENVTENALYFEVRDTGIGIAPKDISRAMAPFGQVDNSLKRKYEGTGLGLPLTKKFVELMGGSFSIESEVNVGTKITFSLPRELTAREGVIIKQVA